MDKININKNGSKTKGVRTGLQALLGVLVFVGGLATVPGLDEFLAQNSIISAGTYSVLVGVIAWLQNYIEDYLKDPNND